MRIVKKTLKGDLMGKTGFKKVGPKARDEELAPAPVPGPQVKPRGQTSLGDLAPRQEDLVIVSDPLHPRHGSSAALTNALPPPPPRTLSPEEQQAAAEAESDIKATSLGATASPAGRRGNVIQVRDGGVPRMVASISATPLATPAVPRAPPQPQPPQSLERAPLGSPAQRAPIHAAKPAAPAPPEGQRASRAPLGTQIEGDAVSQARHVIAEALYRDFGAVGSKVQHARGGSFHVAERFGDGIVRTQHDLLLPLPAGHIVPHTADVVVELEPRGLLLLDIVPSRVAMQDLKARAFDALQLRRIDRCFSVLVFIRCPGTGMAQGQAEAIAHGYDAHFGVDEEHVHSEAKFQALRARIVAWLEAASAANRGMR